MTPFEQKRQIEEAFKLAEQYGFQLVEHHGRSWYTSDGVLMLATPTNEVFAKNTVLNTFTSWSDVTMFFQGYEKAEMAWKMGGKKK